MKLTKMVVTLLLILFWVNVGCRESESTATPTSVAASQEKSSLPAASNSKNSAASRPLYYEREITKADLEGRTLRELTLMRNTIYARAGNPFRKKWLREYFSSQPWYRPAARMDITKLTELDHKNAAIIAEYETKLPRNKLSARKEGLLTKKHTDGRLSADDNIELSLLTQTLGESLAEGDADAQVTPSLEPKLLDKLLTVDQLSDYSRRDLRILRNTIYAKRGRVFKSDILQDYFDRLSWYKPDPAYTDARLTDLDNRNIKIILSVENQLGGPLTEFENKRQDGWFSGA
ncbi:MAG: YARHG domain-containing protein [Acidobacteriota bacterium]